MKLIEIVLRLLSNMIGNSYGDTNFLHKLLLTTRQVGNLCKAFANYLSTDMKLSKTKLSEIIQSREFLGRHLGPLLKTWLPFIKNVLQPLVSSVLMQLGLTSAASAADAGIHKKNLRFWNNNTNTIEWRNGRHYGNSQIS